MYMSSFSVNENSRCVKYVFGTATLSLKHISLIYDNKSDNRCNILNIHKQPEGHSLEYIPLLWNMFQFTILNWYSKVKSGASLKSISISRASLISENIV